MKEPWLSIMYRIIVVNCFQIPNFVVRHLILVLIEERPPAVLKGWEGSVSVHRVASDGTCQPIAT